MAALVGACVSRSAKTASALAECRLAAPHNDGWVVCKGMAPASDPKVPDQATRPAPNGSLPRAYGTQVTQFTPRMIARKWGISIHNGRARGFLPPKLEDATLDISISISRSGICRVCLLSIVAVAAWPALTKRSSVQRLLRKATIIRATSPAQEGEPFLKDLRTEEDERQEQQMQTAWQGMREQGAAGPGAVAAGRGRDVDWSVHVLSSPDCTARWGEASEGKVHKGHWVSQCSEQLLQRI